VQQHQEIEKKQKRRSKTTWQENLQKKSKQLKKHGEPVERNTEKMASEVKLLDAFEG